MIACPTAAAGAQRYAARCFFGAGVFELGIQHATCELPIFGGNVAVVHIHAVDDVGIHPKRLRAAVGQAVHVAVVGVLIARACPWVGIVGVVHAVNLPVVVVELLAVERHVFGRDFARALGGAADVGELHIGVVVQQIGNCAVGVRAGGDLAAGDALCAHFLRKRRGANGDVLQILRCLGGLLAAGFAAGFIGCSGVFRLRFIGGIGGGGGKGGNQGKGE